MSEQVEIVVVGAGVIGCAVAERLARAGHEVFVIEKNPGVTQGENQSSRNSGVIHAGLYYDRQQRPHKARLCVRGNRLLYRFCQRYQVPALQCGKLVVAAKQEEVPILEHYLARARDNGVPCELIPGPRAREMEPNVRAVAALHLPTSGVIDPTALVQKLYALAAGHGAQFLVQTELVEARARGQALELTIRYRDGAQDRFAAGRMINCAGLYADQVARLLEPGSPYTLDPSRGEAACFYRTKRPELWLEGMNVYPTPRRLVLKEGTYFTVGVHLTPTLEPRMQGPPVVGPVVTVGPLNLPARGREDFGGEHQPMRRFWQEVAPFFPGLREDDLQPYQVGVQARLAGHQDWVFHPDPVHPPSLHLLGFDSPALTSCLAIAEKVAGFVERGPQALAPEA